MRSNVDRNKELHEKIVHLGKTSKTVKGGRKFKFVVISVAGDQKGRVGIGVGKASEVMDAREKAIKAAKSNLVRVPLKNGATVHHDSVGKYGASKVIIRTARPGTGIIAGGLARAVLELLGVKDAVIKSVGSSNPHNLLKALMHGLSTIVPPKIIAEKRSKKAGEIVGQRGN